VNNFFDPFFMQLFGDVAQPVSSDDENSHGIYLSNLPLSWRVVSFVGINVQEENSIAY
jgi:hypothetical protein